MTRISTHSRAIDVEVGPRQLGGLLDVPANSQGIVLFAHGSGSGRFSPRNQYVAGELQKAGIATLLFDLLSDTEADDRRKVFDIGLLAQRLTEAAHWTQRQGQTSRLPLGYFGASTGAAAALVAAARQGDAVRAVVSRGGRPDLAKNYLPQVTAPTLLIVGGDDEVVVELNRAACAPMQRIPQDAWHCFCQSIARSFIQMTLSASGTWANGRKDSSRRFGKWNIPWASIYGPAPPLPWRNRTTR